FFSSCLAPFARPEPGAHFFLFRGDGFFSSCLLPFPRPQRGAQFFSCRYLIGRPFSGLYHAKPCPPAPFPKIATEKRTPYAFVQTGGVHFHLINVGRSISS